MAEFPALPLFTDAITADCGHLTDEEFGRYVRILILMWRSPNCRIPHDPQWLCKRLRVDALAYAQHVQPIMQEFCTVDAGYWVQKRLLKEYQYVQGLTEKRRKAADARWNKTQVSEKPKKQPMQMDMQRTSKADAPTPTPTPILDNTSVLSKAPRSNQKIEGEDFEQFFKSYPKPTAQGTARSSFTNAILIRGADPKQIIRAAKNYAAKVAKEPEEERRFIPNPSKWLDSESYLDPDLQAEPKTAPKPQDFPHQWQRDLCQHLPLAHVQSWFTGLVDIAADGKTLIVAKRLYHDRIKQNYMDALRKIGINDVQLNQEHFK